jgi:hypothetical protein
MRGRNATAVLAERGGNRRAKWGFRMRITRDFRSDA